VKGRGHAELGGLLTEGAAGVGRQGFGSA